MANTGAVLWRALLLVVGVLGLVPCPHRACAIPVSGTIRYSGSQGPVSASRPIQILIGGNPFKVGKLGQATVTTDRGSFAFDVPTAGNYFLEYFLDLIPDGVPNVGEPYQFYVNEFSPSNATPLSVPSTGVSGLKLGFSDAFIGTGIAGTVTYAGSLGTVSPQTPLVVEAFTDPTMLGVQFDRARLQTNGARYDLLVPMLSQTLYLVAFLDVNDSGQRHVGEPFEIYQDKAIPPANPVMIGTMQTHIDFLFGDENIMPGTCVGDCDGNSQVAVGEILSMIDIALGNADVSTCLPGDANHDMQITVEEILTAVDNALTGCPSP